MKVRTETKELIARQISLIEGRVWSQLSSALKIQYLTHAENILATVERKLRSCDACILDYIGEWT
jgi:hypothetical protein